MRSRETPDPPKRPPLEIEVEPTVAGRLARWTERAHALQVRVAASRSRHRGVDLGFGVVERDSTIGGGLLAGALAYRLFVFLLPTALLLVSVLGLYAGAVDESPAAVAKEAGLTGLVASQVASTASSGARWLLFLVMLPTVLYAIAKLYRSIAVVHAIVWEGSGRGVRVTLNGVGVFLVVLPLQLVAVELVHVIRRDGHTVGLASLLVYLVFVGGAWLVVSTQLPHRDVRWPALIPGALLFGGGMLFVNVLNIYITTRLVADHADTYGALGIAAAVLFSLVLVGRLMVVAAVLNASLYERRAR